MHPMSELHQIERDMQECRELIATAEALEGLRKNRLYKRVIEENYLNKEAVRNTMNLDHAHLREASIRALAGIASFNGYLQTIDQVADMARTSLKELEEAHAAVLAEV